MAELGQVKKGMEIVGADGVHIGTVDAVDGSRIKLTKADSGSHHGHHHYLSGGLVASVDGDRVRLSANGDAAVLLEEEHGGEAIADKKKVDAKKLGIGAALAGLAAIAGAVFLRRRNRDTRDD